MYWMACCNIWWYFMRSHTPAAKCISEHLAVLHYIQTYHHISRYFMIFERLWGNRNGQRATATYYHPVFKGPVFESQQIGTKVITSELRFIFVDFSKYLYQLFCLFIWFASVVTVFEHRVGWPRVASSTACVGQGSLFGQGFWHGFRRNSECFVYARVQLWQLSIGYHPCWTFRVSNYFHACACRY